MMRLPKPSNLTTGEPSFRWRRVAFFLIVGYCLIFLPILAYIPELPTNNLKIAEALTDLVGWAFLVYAAGAGAQDIAAIVTTRSGRPYADQVQSVDPAPAEPVTVISDKTTVTGGPVTTGGPTTVGPDSPKGLPE